MTHEALPFYAKVSVSKTVATYILFKKYPIFILPKLTVVWCSYLNQ